MKRILTLLLALVGIASAAFAQTAQPVLWLDYCSGQYNSTARPIAEIGDIEVAIHFSHDQLAHLSGNEVSQLAMAFPTTHPTTMTMWIRADRDGENLRQVEVSKITSKWNTYNLDNPLPITGDEQDLWVGATFNQKYASNKYLSLAGTTSAEACFWRNVSTDGQWASLASQDWGSLCIRMGVTGPNIPQHDMSLSRVSAAELTYGIGDVIPFTARIANHGVDDVVNPIVRCSINGEAVADVTVTANIVSSEYADVTVKVPTASVATPGIATFSFEALWADGLPDTHPENNTDATNVGLVKALHDLALENVRTSSALYKLGSSITVSGLIRNNNFATAQNPQIAYSLNGGEVTKKGISCTLKNGETKEFSFSIPTRSIITEDGDAVIDLELLWRDGSADDYAADNKAQVKARLTSAAPNRRMVVEEGTGTWCGWCVRGIVGLHDMAAKYGDRFIGIAIHNNDEMACGPYNVLLGELGISGYPGCFINREPGQRDPNFNTLENYMKSMPEYADVSVDIQAEASAQGFALKALVTPMADLTQRDYRVLFVITEDNITGMQQNYYAGGGSGTMGGYEKLGSPVKVDFLDVARGIWPASTAAEATGVSLPADMQAGQVYTVDLNLAASKVTYKSLDELNYIALVIDAETELIVNAAKFSQKLVGIHSVLAPETTDAPAYNLAGQPAAPAQHGVIIQQGKKVIR